MDDNLKKYINDNQEKLSWEKPSDDLWNKIDTDLRPEKKKSSRWFQWKIAASLLFALGLGMITMKYLLRQPEGLQADTTTTKEAPIHPLSDISPDLAEVESFYIQKVHVTMNQLKEYEVDDELIEEVDNLKQEFEDLKKEMGLGADQSIVVEAMIDNYRLRLRLLEDLLDAVKDGHQQNKIDYEKSI